MAPRALRHKQRKIIFILQTKPAPRGWLCLLFHRKGHDGQRHIPAVRLRLPLWFSFCTQKRTYPAAMLFTKRQKLQTRDYALHGKQPISVKKQNSQTRGTCRGKAPPSCSRKNVLPLESPTGAFIAAQPRSGCSAIIKNNFSAEYAQSEAEGIPNRQAITPAESPPLPAGWTPRPHCPGR